MKRTAHLLKFIFALFILFYNKASAQTYKPDWESLDKRPVPQWYTQSKFGIFIHWGVYAVPGWSTKGSYAEWYQQGLQTNDTARQAYQKKKFGNRTYYDLANDFKAELFNPDEWASVIESSGAKYVVLTSKHHDGFALWPSKENEKVWSMPWNAGVTGPHRDLIGALFTSLRKTSVHPGLYYSLYEWFNPLLKADKAAYVSTYMQPQMHDLINTYKPDVLWTDGDWDQPAELWKSQQFLTWLYNDSPVKNTIVTYDRWGSGIRFHHGSVYTPEYQPDLDFEDHPWEESRGMGYSYGYNRAEDAWDYATAQSLIVSLVDKVSRGGNFLLDIGPDEHGKIPPIMQERLLQMGDWMKLNGEAIYNTVRWKNPSQWSQGNRDYKAKKLSGDFKVSNDYMLKLTVDPDPGYAVKEVFYTYNPTTNSLYAILPKYPSNKQIVLKDVVLSDNTNVSLLGYNASLSWKPLGNNTIITLPNYDPNLFKAPYAYVIKVLGYGSFLPKPKIEVQQNNRTLQARVSISVPKGSDVFYTTDGSEPTNGGNKYSAPFTLKKKATVKAVAIGNGILNSGITSQEVPDYNWNSAVKHGSLKLGINYEYSEPAGKIDMLVAEHATSKTTGIVNDLSLTKKERGEKFTFRFSGYINILTDDIYTFTLDSDDGSKLLIDDQQVALLDGDKLLSIGSIALKKGMHKINLIYFDSGGANHFTVLMKHYNGEQAPIPATILFH